MQLLAILPVFSAFLLHLAAASPRAHTQQAQCRCLPGDSCWPKPDVWKGLNQTVNNRLIKVVPIGAQCHDPHYDAKACEALQAQWLNPLLHIESPSSPMQLSFGNQSCDPFTPREQPCELGNIVSYVVNATSPNHIASAIKFAQKHNIRFVVRNTGHDFFGRSTGAGALSVWTHHMKSVELLDYKSDVYTGKAVRLGAGVQGSEALEFANSKGLVVVAGECPTVGVAGGFTQGGGHSPLSTEFGMAADQVLSYNVVTADGRTLRASPTENQDLYWALSGGGGGTYAVVTSMTVRAHAAAQVGGGKIVIAANASAPTETFSKIIAKLHKLLPEMVDNGAAVGYLLMAPALTIGPITVFNSTGGFVQNSVAAPFLSALDKMGVSYTSEFTTKSYRDHYDHYYGPLPVGSVFSTAVQSGGRLVPRAAVEDASDEVSAAISDIIAQQAIVVGSVGSYTAPTNKVPNAVLPAWRNTLIQLQVSVPWSTDPTYWQDMLGVQTFINDALMPMIKKVTPGGASYLNEASIKEQDWKTAFFGPNYKKLEKIKAKWDKGSLFYIDKGVGSEKWNVDAAGRMCRA
ncbi:Ff.00g116720.m01.CDS01 [Fusarium sp. VM40]|nr:Ff.00g116720.m01.CDS01 [Fusarium sp. VM40]